MGCLGSLYLSLLRSISLSPPTLCAGEWSQGKTSSFGTYAPKRLISYSGRLSANIDIKARECELGLYLSQHRILDIHTLYHTVPLVMSSINIVTLTSSLSDVPTFLSDLSSALQGRSLSDLPHVTFPAGTFILVALPVNVAQRSAQ